MCEDEFDTAHADCCVTCTPPCQQLKGWVRFAKVQSQAAIVYITTSGGGAFQRGLIDVGNIALVTDARLDEILQLRRNLLPSLCPLGSRPLATAPHWARLAVG